MAHNIDTAVAYYTAISKKEVNKIEKYLHPQVHFLTPLFELSGKERVVEAVKKFTMFFNRLTIRTQFENRNQVVIIYDLIFPEPVGEIRGASLLTCEGDLISDIELFYDPRPLEVKKN